MVCPLDTATVTELWGLELFSFTSSPFLSAGTLSPRGKCCYFVARGLVGVDKHLFQMVSLVTSMTLPPSITRQCRCYFETETTKYCLKHEGKSLPCQP